MKPPSHPDTAANHDSGDAVPGPDVVAESVRRRSPWGVAAALPLFLYGAAPLLYGGVGLLFVPAILAGGVGIGRHTTVAKIVGWILFHLLVTAHGCAIIAAGISFSRLRWRRGLRILAVGVAVPGVLIAALYIAILAFGLGE